MLFFGHVGLTVGAAQAADRDLDLRAAAALAVAPDLLDKPLRWVAPALVRHNSRSFGHTLLASLLVLGALWAARRGVKRPGLLWACFAGHGVLDRLWLYDNPAVFLWPLLGAFPPPQTDLSIDRLLTRYNLAGEAAGLAVLLALAWRHGLLHSTRLRAFLRTGRLGADTKE